MVACLRRFKSVLAPSELLFFFKGRAVQPGVVLDSQKRLFAGTSYHKALANLISDADGP